MEKICQKGLKVAKYSAKFALVTRELIAEDGWGGSPQWTYVNGMERLEVVCGSVNSSWAHRVSRTKRVERGKIFQ